METQSQNKKYLAQNVDNIVIDSGNLLVVEDIKRKASILPTEEFVEGMQQIVNQWQQIGNLKTDNNIAFLTNNQNNSLNRISSAERQTFRITVKMFLFDDCGGESDCPSLVNGVDIVLKQLDIKSVDSLILSLPNRSTKLTLDDIKPIWKCAQTIVTNGRATQLGISDLDTNQLIQLYEWADTSKPTTNHINLESCCVIPQEMSEYAKKNNIQLLTHNDPRDFMPKARFEKILSDLVSDVKQWKPVWIARYSLIIAGKGILQNKGYILSTKKLN